MTTQPGTRAVEPVAYRYRRPEDAPACPIAYRCVPGLYSRRAPSERNPWRTEPAPAEAPPAGCSRCHARPAGTTTPQNPQNPQNPPPVLGDSGRTTRDE